MFPDNIEFQENTKTSCQCVNREQINTRKNPKEYMILLVFFDNIKFEKKYPKTRINV